jgi:hypothetical protein
MFGIPCVLKPGDLIDSENLKNLNVSDIVCYKYHVMWNITFSQYNIFSTLTDTDLRHKLKMVFVVRCFSFCLRYQ